VIDGLPPYIGFAGLWRLEVSGMDIARLGPLLESRLARDPQNADAMMDIATLSILTLIPENRQIAFEMQAKALAIKQFYRIEAGRKPVALRVLVLVGAGDMTALTHLDCMLEGDDVELLMLYVRPGHPLPVDLPNHDLVFVALGESEASRPLLEQISHASFSRPVLNPASRILELSRDSVSRKLGGIAGLEVPQTVKTSRSMLQRVATVELALPSILPQGRFPLIVRPVDSQGGKELVKVTDPSALSDYLSATVANEYFIARFIDYSGPDRFFRKYRVVLIDGRAFACHMAISDHWMIHYVNADMDASEWKRLEEARFMAEFDPGFAARHMHALQAMDRALGLDYYAVDCAETREGELLIFEVDTAMLVHAMDPAELYPYKQPQMRTVFDAFRRMLDRRNRTQ
jgi:glutathione synthase/RimK-type ligase-like ATP-grasp enzyme